MVSTSWSITDFGDFYKVCFITDGVNSFTAQLDSELVFDCSALTLTGSNKVEISLNSSRCPSVEIYISGSLAMKVSIQISESAFDDFRKYIYEMKPIDHSYSD